MVLGVLFGPCCKSSMNCVPGLQMTILQTAIGSPVDKHVKILKQIIITDTI